MTKMTPIFGLVLASLISSCTTHYGVTKKTPLAEKVKITRDDSAEIEAIYLGSKEQGDALSWSNFRNSSGRITGNAVGQAANPFYIRPGKVTLGIYGVRFNKRTYTKYIKFKKLDPGQSVHICSQIEDGRWKFELTATAADCWQDRKLDYK